MYVYFHFPLYRTIGLLSNSQRMKLIRLLGRLRDNASAGSCVMDPNALQEVGCHIMYLNYY